MKCKTISETFSIPSFLRQRFVSLSCIGKCLKHGFWSSKTFGPGQHFFDHGYPIVMVIYLFILWCNEINRMFCTNWNEFCFFLNMPQTRCPTFHHRCSVSPIKMTFYVIASSLQSSTWPSFYLFKHLSISCFY